MVDLEAVAAAWRAALLSRTADAESQMRQAWAVVYGRLKSQIDALEGEIEERVARGGVVTASEMRRSERLRALLNQVEAETRRFAAGLNPLISSLQAAAAVQAIENSASLLGVIPSFNRIPVSAVEHLVGTLGDGGPLRKLLDDLGPAASKAVREALLGGLATGMPIPAIAREMRSQANLTLLRAKRIARTETIRAYREASLETYQANRSILRGWTWTASLSSRTCAACIAMHGTTHSVDTPFTSHPNCRCVPVPMTKSYRELGINVEEDFQPPQTGIAWFRSQPESVQRQIVGSEAAYRALNAGSVTLPDFVGRGRGEFGPYRYQKSLKQILGAKRAATFYERKAA